MKCRRCNREMRFDPPIHDEDDGMYVCDPCDAKDAEAYRERQEWDYYHND